MDGYSILSNSPEPGKITVIGNPGGLRNLIAQIEEAIERGSSIEQALLVIREDPWKPR